MSDFFFKFDFSEYYVGSLGDFRKCWCVCSVDVRIFVQSREQWIPCGGSEEITSRSDVISPNNQVTVGPEPSHTYRPGGLQVDRCSDVDVMCDWRRSVEDLGRSRDPHPFFNPAQVWLIRLIYGLLIRRDAAVCDFFFLSCATWSTVFICDFETVEGVTLHVHSVPLFTVLTGRRLEISRSSVPTAPSTRRSGSALRVVAPPRLEQDFDSSTGSSPGQHFLRASDCKAKNTYCHSVGAKTEDCPLSPSGPGQGKGTSLQANPVEINASPQCMQSPLLLLCF